MEGSHREDSHKHSNTTIKMHSDYALLEFTIVTRIHCIAKHIIAIFNRCLRQ